MSEVPENSGRHAILTPRERDVARLLLNGLGLGEIADHLYVSVETVRMHVKHEHAKTETRNLHALALWLRSHHSCCVADQPSDDLPVLG